MLNGSKKYRGIKFLNVKVLNKSIAKKSLSINNPILSNKGNEKSIKSSGLDYPFRTEEEKRSNDENFFN